VIVSLIVAMDERRGIGKNGTLPWRLSSDLKRFRELTMGHHLIVGRKTFDSIGRALPGRQMIVVTQNPLFEAEGVLKSLSVMEALDLAKQRGETEVFVIGGAEIYSQILGLADRIYLTKVHATVDVDTFCPEFDAKDWREVHTKSHPADDKNQYETTFSILERKDD
jgi:dihydrofolate reductase